MRERTEPVRPAAHRKRGGRVQLQGQRRPGPRMLDTGHRVDDVDALVDDLMGELGADVTPSFRNTLRGSYSTVLRLDKVLSPQAAFGVPRLTRAAIWASWG